MGLIEQERDWERTKAFFEAGERAADYRAGLIAAQVRNAQRTDKNDRYFEPTDFFPALKRAASDAAATAGDAIADAMTTEQTVKYLREGFSLFVPH